MSKSRSGIFIATESGASQVGDEVYTFTKDTTRVREGHPLLKVVPDYFQPIEEHLHYGAQEPHVAAVTEQNPPSEPDPLQTPEDGEQEYVSPSPENAPQLDEALEGNIASVAEYINTLTDVATLQMLADKETEGKDRAGVHQHILERMSELEQLPPSSGTTAGLTTDSLQRVT